MPLGTALPPPSERVAAVRAAALIAAEAAIVTTARIAAVPAPTGEEMERSAVVRDLFASEGLATTVDQLGDVVAVIPGVRGGGTAVLLAAHLDTVFVAGTPLRVRRDKTRLHGPGVGDNSLGVAALVALPGLLRAAGFVPAVDLLLTGNVGEEGLGDLRGMRAVMDARPEVAAAVAIEGHNLGRVTHVAVGSRRLRITVRGAGGHSWGDFGRANAIHGLAGIITELDALALPRAPKTTLNVGVIEGGVSVNTIAPEASCLLDLRSVDEAALGQLADRVSRLMSKPRPGLTVTAEVIGNRPAGVVPLDSPIVRLATAVLAALGVDAAYDASSTDANVPIARGIPAICIGLTTGGNVHRPDEYIDLAPVAVGLAQLALLGLGLADAVAAGVDHPASAHH